MKAEYGFSKMKGRKNPYASKLKKQVTIRMGEDVIAYFKAMVEETGITDYRFTASLTFQAAKEKARVT